MCYSNLNTPIRNKYQFFARKIFIEMVDHMRAQGGKGRGGRCEEGRASGFFRTGCFGILNLGWLEYWIQQTCLCICTQREKKEKKHKHRNTNTAPPDFHLAHSPLHAPSRTPSLWAMLLFEPLAQSLLPPLLVPSRFKPLLFFYLFTFILSLLSPLSLAPCLPPLSPPCLRDNSIINCPSWPILLINSSCWGSPCCCCMRITLLWTRRNGKHHVDQD